MCSLSFVDVCCALSCFSLFSSHSITYYSLFLLLPAHSHSIRYGQEALSSMLLALSGDALPRGVSESEVLSRLVASAAEGTPFRESVARLEGAGAGRLTSACAFALRDLCERSTLTSGTTKPTVKKFLSALLTTVVLNQNILFHVFVATMDFVIDQAKKAHKVLC
jgi:hypothetical protein